MVRNACMVTTLSYRQSQNPNPEISASSPLVFLLSHPVVKASLLFLLFTNNKENEYLCLFLQSQFSSGPFNHLSICLSFYLRLSPEAFHMLTHWHICALKCFQTLRLLSCSTSLVFLSYFYTSQPFFLVNWFEFFIWLVL